MGAEEVCPLAVLGTFRFNMVVFYHLTGRGAASYRKSRRRVTGEYQDFGAPYHEDHLSVCNDVSIAISGQLSEDSVSDTGSVSDQGDQNYNQPLMLNKNRCRRPY
jgi:hypothetical protein